MELSVAAGDPRTSATTANASPGQLVRLAVGERAADRVGGRRRRRRGGRGARRRRRRGRCGTGCRGRGRRRCRRRDWRRGRRRRRGGRRGGGRRPSGRVCAVGAGCRSELPLGAADGASLGAADGAALGAVLGDGVWLGTGVGRGEATGSSGVDRGDRQRDGRRGRAAPGWPSRRRGSARSLAPSTIAALDDVGGGRIDEGRVVADREGEVGGVPSAAGPGGRPASRSPA